MDDSIKREFHNKIGRLTRSRAYLDYCEAVYGYRMYLFNMMDQDQLDYVFKKIPLSADDTLVDLGCGSGSILDALVKKSGCAGVGIDQLNREFVEIEPGSAQYLKGDIDDFDHFHLHPTITLSIDSIYFSRDPEALIRSLCDVKNNRIYMFYSQYLLENSAADKQLLRGDFTKVAEILKRIQAPYDMIEYSYHEKMLYSRSLYALEKREAAFRNEGYADLYEGMMRELRLGLHLYDTGNASRYLYIIG